MAHIAEVISVEEAADGILAVRVRCCKNPSTDSVLSLYELHRSHEEIDADIHGHLSRVETLHAAREHAKAHIERLMKK